MPDVEFLTGDASDEQDELLDTGPRRPLPRWVLLAGVLVAAALIVAVVVRQGGASAPRADPSAPVSTSAPTSPSEQVAPPSYLAEAYSLTGDERDHRLYALVGSQLFKIGVDGRQVGPGASVQVGNATNDDVELVLDAAHDIIWAVPQNATGHDGNFAGFAEPFDTGTVKSVARIPLPGLVESAAVLGGQLYVTTDLGLWRTTSPGAPFEHVAGAASTGDAMLIADPTRHRLICVRFGSRSTQARFFRLGHGTSPPRALPLSTISLAVVGQTIWLSGSLHGHPLLTSLDPSTLRVGQNVAHGSADVDVQGTGRHSLYVGVGTRLVCLSGSNGRLLRDFGPSLGSFASVGDHGFFGANDALQPVAMGRCPG